MIIISLRTHLSVRELFIVQFLVKVVVLSLQDKKRKKEKKIYVAYVLQCMLLIKHALKQLVSCHVKYSFRMCQQAADQFRSIIISSWLFCMGKPFSRMTWVLC